MADGPLDLDALRREIDAVDDRILELLNERARLVRGVAAWKEQHARPFYVPERERQVVERLSANNSGPFPTDGIRPVFGEIMSACLSLEQRLRVAYLGPEATFTHQASRSRFGLSARYIPAATIAGVFAEVEKGSAELGVIPVENSTEGVVSHTLDVFMESDLAIQQEIVIAVSLCLLTRATGLSEVRKVYSHPQAIAQCRRWLGTNLPGAAPIEVASTAMAARLARDDVAAAAVASELAAQLYDLPVARRRIEDERVNFTRFLVIGRAEPPSPPVPGRAYKTSIMFTLKDRPGGLHHALAPFAAHDVNLSRIESRPSRRRAWDYVFFVDVEGHPLEPATAAAIAEFRSGCELVKLLGTYARAPEPAVEPERSAQELP
jgi:chorismate mutase/prephenate dehydratase